MTCSFFTGTGLNLNDIFILGTLRSLAFNKADYKPFSKALIITVREWAT